MHGFEYLEAYLENTPANRRVLRAQKIKYSRNPETRSISKTNFLDRVSGKQTTMSKKNSLVPTHNESCFFYFKLLFLQQASIFQNKSGLLREKNQVFLTVSRAHAKKNARR